METKDWIKLWTISKVHWWYQILWTLGWRKITPDVYTDKVNDNLNKYTLQI